AHMEIDSHSECGGGGVIGVDAETSVKNVVTVRNGTGGRSGKNEEGIVAIITFNLIIAITANQNVVFTASFQPVVAGAAMQDVVVAATVQLVVSATATNDLEVGDRITADLDTLHILFLDVSNDGLDECRKIDRVNAGTAM